MVKFGYFWTLYCYISFPSLQELTMRHWSILSKHSRSCFQIRESASLPFLCCKHEEGLAGCRGAVVGLFWCVCFTLNSRSWEWSGTSHEVRVFTFSDCLLMLPYIRFKSSDISIGSLPGKFFCSLSKYFSLMWHSMFLFLFFAVTAYRTLSSLSSSIYKFSDSCPPSA